MTSTRLSPKSGDACFLCGEPDGTVRRGGVGPHRFGSWSHQPCAQCSERMSRGCILISVRDGGQDPYRTGGWIVITDDAIRRLIRSPELLNDVLRKRVAFVEDSTLDAIGLPRREKQRRRRHVKAAAAQQ